jgi:hypothetical protein
MQKLVGFADDLGLTVGAVGTFAALITTAGIVQPNLGAPKESTVVESPSTFA